MDKQTIGIREQIFSGHKKEKQNTRVTKNIYVFCCMTDGPTEKVSQLLFGTDRQWELKSSFATKKQFSHSINNRQRFKNSDTFIKKNLGIPFFKNNSLLTFTIC